MTAEARELLVQIIEYEIELAEQDDNAGRLYVLRELQDEFA